MAWRRIGIVAIGSLVLLGGCGGTQYSRSDRERAERDLPPLELVAQSRPPIPDLPVPMGFDMDEQASRSFAAGGTRFVDHAYAGRADKYAVSRFYKRHMPVCRWVLVTDMFVQGKIMLEFEKEHERCHISIGDNGVIRPVRIEAQVWVSGPVTMAAVPAK